MASFHLAVKTIGRSAGRSATAAAAYRAGVEITDERTGLVHDYTRKQGVEHSALVVPADAPAWANDRAALWNAAEQAETRKNSTVAREYEIALPAELSAEA
ncbi:MAG TPA: conjugal transfer protein TraA, partial [Gammaproteobacteria bacterium]|nr:conjugal transfer protein TraA [Gammaproteobacteria bacterium]